MPQFFTDEEKRIILNHSHKESCALLPHRNPRVISVTRCRLKNLEEKGALKGQRWSLQEIKIIREQFAITPTKELAKQLPGRTTADVQWKARNLGLRKQFDPSPTLEGEGHKQIVYEIINGARSCGITLQWLDRLCGSGFYFGEKWRKIPLNLTAVARAVELLGFRLRIDKTYQPLGADGKRLVDCIVRFSREPVQPTAPKAKQPKLIAKRGAAPVYPSIQQSRATRSIIDAIAALVPRGIVGRDDIIQEILLALHEGRITVDQVRTNRKDITAFFRSFMRTNFEGAGYAKSLDEPLRDGRSRYDIIPGASG